MAAVQTYCCDDLRERAEYTCPDHADRSHCPDVIISRYADGTVGIPIHDGGTSMVQINNCPWCGADLRAV